MKIKPILTLSNLNQNDIRSILNRSLVAFATEKIKPGKTFFTWWTFFLFRMNCFRKFYLMI